MCRANFKKNIPQGSPEIKVEVSLLNTQTNAAKATVNCEIISPDGKSLKKFSESEKLKRKSQGIGEIGNESFLAGSLVAGIAKTLQARHHRFRRRQSR